MAFQRIEQPFVLPSSGTANGTTSPERVDHLKNLGLQIDGVFTGTVTVEVRASPSMAFQPLESFSAPVVYPVPNDMPLYQMRLVVTGYAAGTITALFVGRTAQM